MPKYDVVGNWDHLDFDSKARVVNYASDTELEKWASDSDCNQRFLAREAWRRRRGGFCQNHPETPSVAFCYTCGKSLCFNCSHLIQDVTYCESCSAPGIVPPRPFDPRVETSADARYIAGHIVKHLWIIFVALPFVAALLFAIFR
jgi:B-box zinc finger